MKIIMNLSCLFLVSLAAVGCAGSGVKRGVVAMKISDTEAHVGMGSDELNVGDHVELYHNICTGGGGGARAIREGSGGPGSPRTCTKKEVGHGEVTQVLSKDYSIVKFPAGTDFSEGSIIEKHAH